MAACANLCCCHSDFSSFISWVLGSIFAKGRIAKIFLNGFNDIHITSFISSNKKNYAQNILFCYKIEFYIKSVEPLFIFAPCITFLLKN